MGTRHFYPVEEKNSRIQWEKADPDTAQKLVSAINKNSHGIVSAKIARVVVFFPGVILLVLLAGYLNLIKNNYARLVFDIELFFYILYGALIVFFSVFMLRRYIKFRPYLYPEKQPDIWIFRAKCGDISRSGMRSDETYYANFQKGGGHICIRIQWFEYKANPTGKEYIFYKFNDHTGNRWAAIAADRLDEV